MRAITSDGIWRLEAEGDKYLSLIPHDLNYFHDHFVGRPMTHWTAPPITASGKSKKLPDFVRWMIGAPVVSERAKAVLQDLLGDSVQFLPFHEIKGKPYYAVNVTSTQDGLLDVARSDISYSDDEPKVAYHLNRARFLMPNSPSLPPMFKVAIGKGVKPFGDVFVTKRFADAAIKHQLTGIALTDPATDGMRDILARRSRNVVPGLAQ